MRCIGKGQTAGRLLCGILNLPNPPTSNKKYFTALCSDLYTVAQNSMNAAAREAVVCNKGKCNLFIAYDGSWQKRGFKSKKFCGITSVGTGKVLDVEVLSSYCQKCNLNKGKPMVPHDCKNFEGSSGMMESRAAVTIFQRPFKTRGVRYTTFLGDCESKAFEEVFNCKPYGDTAVSKLECVGHVHKRMGSRFRKLKSMWGKKLLEDGKTIGGKGRLTKKLINQMQDYYGQAIRDNTNDLKAMLKAVWAIYYHKISSDEEPNHALCSDEWCQYRKAKMNGTLEDFHHTKSVPKVVMKEIHRIFKDLANPELLKKCLYRSTQNVNESFNNIIWSRIPKNIFVGKETLQIGVYDGLISFNDGAVSKVNVLKELGIGDVGSNCISVLEHFNSLRVKTAENFLEETLSMKRKKNEARKRKQNEEKEAKHDEGYSAGSF